MKRSISTVYKVVVASAFVILLCSIACEPDARSLYFMEVLRTNESDVYMVSYSSYFDKKVTYFRDKNQHQDKLFFIYYIYPSKEELKSDLEKVPPFGPKIDSVGVYSKVNDEVVAMFYSKGFEDKGKVSSTNYSNPFLREYWDVYFDEEEYAKGEWYAHIGSVTFTLKKLEE